MTTALTQSLPDAAAQMLDTVQDAADGILEDVQEIWPVDTGESRDGWEIQVSGDEVSLVNRVDYVPYVHGGFALAEAELIFDAAMGDLLERLEQDAFFSLSKTLQQGTLADLFKLPASSAYRAGGRTAREIVRANIAAELAAMDEVF